jgi:hypothetical protein
MLTQQPRGQLYAQTKVGNKHINKRHNKATCIIYTIITIPVVQSHQPLRSEKINFIYIYIYIYIYTHTYIHLE